MLHKDILQQLFPVALGGVFPIDLAIEGDHLDQAREGSAALLYELFPDQATELLSDWERVCGLTLDDTETPQSRRQRVVAQLRSVGRMDQAYYIELAAELGYTITIEELMRESFDGGSRSTATRRNTILRQVFHAPAIRCCHGPRRPRWKGCSKTSSRRIHKSYSPIHKGWKEKSWLKRYLSTAIDRRA